MVLQNWTIVDNCQNLNYFFVPRNIKNQLIQALETAKMDNKTVLISNVILASEPNTRLLEMNAQHQLALTATIIKIPAVLSATINRLLAASGKLPKVKISQKCIGVLRTDVDAYLAQKRIA